MSVEQMRRLDYLTIHKYGVSSLSLMERAGQSVVDVICKNWLHTTQKGVLVVTGSGNNGGDGWVIARLLRAQGVFVEVASVARAEDLSPDASVNFEKYLSEGGSFKRITLEELEDFRCWVEVKGLLVDALLGTGLKGSVRALMTEVIQILNKASSPIISVDTPSGLDSNEGMALGVAIQAQSTVTFGFPKWGQVIYPGFLLCGELVVADIGLSQEALREISPQVELLDSSAVRGLLPSRREDSHKGDYGHLLVMAGSRGKTGAAILSCRGALRVGTGLVTLAAPHGLNNILASALVEPMTEVLGEPSDGDQWSPLSVKNWLSLSGKKSAVLFGPGVGVHDATQAILETLLEHCTLPWLIDADGLNSLAVDVKRLREARTPPVLTPHPGEMSRLVNREIADINSHRMDVARDFATKYRCYVVLKGTRTVIASPDGCAAVNSTGHSGMATGGMGDVLSGIVAGFLAQGLPPEAAMRLGVYLHGGAGDRVAQDRGAVGLTASEVAEALPLVIHELSGRKRL